MFHEMNLTTMFCFLLENFLEKIYYRLHQKIGKILDFFFFGAIVQIQIRFWKFWQKSV
jgi:hypothetical protein